LYCGYNKIKSFNNLPNELIIFECNNNKLTSLDFNLINVPLLEELDCSHNNLTVLNNLPISVTKLNCSNNNHLTNIIISK